MSRENGSTFIHETAVVSDEAAIGEGSQVWVGTQVREGATIGEGTTLSKGVYIDKDVVVGANVKIQNNVSVFHGVTIEDGVFVGPHVVFTNDLFPRAISPSGEKLNEDEWEVSETVVEYGASIGANSSIKAGVTIGRWALIGMGSVVTHDVPEYALAFGAPAKVVGKVNEEGQIVERY